MIIKLKGIYMVTKIKQLFSDSFAFAIATLGNKLVAFLLVPILTRLLVPASMGVWDATNTLTMVVTYLCILGTDAAFAFYYFDLKDEEERKSYFSTMVFYSVGVSVLLLGIVTFFSNFFSALLYKNNAYSNILILALVATVEAIFIQHLLALTRYERRVWMFNILSMTYVIGSTVLNVLFVYMGYGVAGIMWGQVIAGGITALILLFIYRHQFTLRVKKEYLVNLLKYGMPIVPSLICFWIMNSYSRLLIFHLNSPTEAGFYAVAVRFASFIVLITSAFQLAWRPFAMSIKDHKDAPEIFSLIARFLVVFGTLAILGLTFFIKPIMILVTTKEYSISYPIIWMLSLSTLLNTLYVIFSVGLLISKKTKAISQAFIIGSLFYLVMNVILIPKYSYWATAIVTLITYLFIVYFVYFKSQKHYAIPFQMGAITAYLSIYLTVMGTITYLQINNVASMWIYDIVGLVIVVASIFVTRVFSIQTVVELRRKIPSLISSFKNP